MYVVEKEVPLVNLAVIGTGYWGANLIRNFHIARGSSLVSICDKDTTRLNRIGSHFPDVKTYDSPEKVLSDPKVDAVAIATSSSQHFSLAKAALLYGKHVFVEKPITLRVGHAKELIRIASDKDLRLMVGHLLYYHPAFEHVEHIVKNGELGKLVYLYSTRVNLGKFRELENALWNLAPHDIAMLLALVKEEPVEVSAQGRSFLRREVEDVTFILMKFNSGLVAQVHVSWLDPHKRRELTVVGDKKMLIFDDMQPTEKVRVFDKGALRDPKNENYGDHITIRTGDVLSPHIPMEEPLLKECEHFVQCVRDGLTPRSDGKNGLKVLQVLEAASRSLKTGGQPVPIEENRPLDVKKITTDPGRGSRQNVNYVGR